VRIVTAEEIDRVLSYGALIDALREAFRGQIEAPARHHHTVPQPGTDATLLLMPAWTGAIQSGRRYLGCKLVTVFPDNVPAGKPSVHGSYFLMSGEAGEPLAILEGRALTAWRTAAASALAASFLARDDASHLLMVGAGTLAPHLVRAHATVRPLKRVTLWNRTRHRAVATAFGLATSGIEIEVVDDLEQAARDADIISCATLATTPLIDGNWLKKGAHVDLVGAFTPKMREVDDRAIKRARVFVDTRAGAMKEAGDIVQPIRRKVLGKEDIEAELSELCSGRKKGRKTAGEITLFKSVGTAIEDLAAAMLVWQSLDA